MKAGLAGKIAVVTGGGSGIGEAICKRLAADGAEIAALDISLPTAEATIGEIGDGLALEVDVAHSAAVEEAVAEVEREIGPPDVFVNNAGAIGIEHVRRLQPRLQAQGEERAAGETVKTPLDALVRLTDEEWRELLAIHLDGTFYGTRAAARSMAERGGGSIINMASICGFEGCTGHPHYSAAKAGILGLTRAIAKELIVQGIRVNAVAPGFVDTSKNRDELGSRRQAEANRTPAGRLGTPEEVAATVAFLASDDASFYVGATLSPNGGLVTAV